MRGSTVGRKRRVSDAQIKRLRKWKPFREWAAAEGLTPQQARFAMRYEYKQVRP